jgi:hypothetical protein
VKTTVGPQFKIVRLDMAEVAGSNPAKPIGFLI